MDPDEELYWINRMKKIKDKDPEIHARGMQLLREKISECNKKIGAGGEDGQLFDTLMHNATVNRTALRLLEKI
jgi:hypothetical protein